MLNANTEQLSDESLSRNVPTCLGFFFFQSLLNINTFQTSNLTINPQSNIDNNQQVFAMQSIILAPSTAQFSPTQNQSNTWLSLDRLGFLLLLLVLLLLLQTLFAWDYPIDFRFISVDSFGRDWGSDWISTVSNQRSNDIFAFCRNPTFWDANWKQLNQRCGPNFSFKSVIEFEGA